MAKRTPDIGSEQKKLFGHGSGYSGNTERPIDYDDEPVAATETPTPDMKPKMKDFSADELIAMALLDQLPEEVPGVTESRRLQFLRKHPDWIPDSESEVTASIGDDRFENPPLVTYLLAVKAKNMEAVRKVIRKISGIRVNATRKIEELEKAYDQNGDYLSSVVRDDSSVRLVLAQYIYAVNELNIFDWPNPNISHQKYVVRNKTVERQKVGISDALLRRSDEELSALIFHALSSEHKRASFWAKQEELALAHPDTEFLFAAVRSNV